MSFNKKFFTTGGIVASQPAAAGLDPLQNFETVTYTGNGATTQKITGYIRKGAAFNGSSSYIDLGTDTFNTLTSYSFSCFVNLASSKNYNFLLDAFEYNGSTSRGFGVRINSSNNVQVVNYNNNTATTVTSSGTITNNTWTHIAVTNTQSNIVISIGGSEESPVSTSGFNFHSSTIYKLGAFQYTGNPVEYHLNGKIDQVRLFNTALNSTQIGQLADEEYGDAENSVTDFFGNGSGVALYELDDDANDTGRYAYGTGAIDSGQSAVFNGSSSIINLPNGSFQNTTFTVSAWIFPTVAQYSSILNTYDYIGVSKGFNFRMNNNRTIGFFSYANDSGDTNSLTTTDTIPLNDWSHVCVTYAAGGSIYIYINGIEVASQTVNSTPVDYHAQGVVQIGAANYSTSDPIEQQTNGKIDQLRIYSSALSASNVEALASETNVPTANLVAHYKLDGNANDSQGSNNGTATSVTYTDPAEFPLVQYNGTPTNVNFLGMAFQPDFVWIKSRDVARSHYLYDSIRGVNEQLRSDTGEAEYNPGFNRMSSFNSNGFTVNAEGAYPDETNKNGEDYVAWCWKAGGAAVSNTDGSITSQVSANPDAGFSIVKHTVPSSEQNYTIGHGLSQKPDMVILKGLDIASTWFVWHKDLSQESYYLYLQETFAESDLTQDTRIWGQQSFTDSVISMRSNYTTQLNDDYIAYCFHSVDGYQKVGSYSGLGATNVTVTLGFSPRFVLIKRATGGNGSWVMYDNLRQTGTVPYDNYTILLANSSYQEQADNTIRGIQFTSTGFVLNKDYVLTNSSGSEYIYLAIA